MLNTEFIEEQKAKLLEEKVRIEQELGFVAEKDEHGNYTTKYDNIGDEDEDNATERESFESNLAVEQDLSSILNKINAALNNIEKGTYGKCSGGDEIEIERLRVLPWADSCINHSA